MSAVTIIFNRLSRGDEHAQETERQCPGKQEESNTSKCPRDQERLDEKRPMLLNRQDYMREVSMEFIELELLLGLDESSFSRAQRRDGVKVQPHRCEMCSFQGFSGNIENLALCF